LWTEEKNNESKIKELEEIKKEDNKNDNNNNNNNNVEEKENNNKLYGKLSFSQSFLRSMVGEPLPKLTPNIKQIKEHWKQWVTHHQSNLKLNKIEKSKKNN